MLDLSAFGSPRAVVLTAAGTSGFAGTEASVSTGFSNIDTITAPVAAGDQLTGDDATSDWNLAAVTTYTSGGQTVTFSGFNTLTGGALNDTFHVTAAQSLVLQGGAGSDTFDIDAVLTGSIDAGADSDTLDIGATVSGAVNGGAGIDTLQGSLIDLVVLTNSDISGFDGTEDSLNAGGANGFTDFETIVGNGGTLTGENLAATWLLDGTPTYTESGVSLNFSGFATLQGGTAVDTFNVTAASTFDLNGGNGNDVFDIDAIVTGAIDGQGGDNTLRGDVINAVLLTSSDAGGFDGDEPDIIGSFDNIRTLVGNGGTLTGQNATSTWTLNTAPTYATGGNTLNFSGFTTLAGGSGDDTFDVFAADFARAVTLAGNDAANDTLNFNAQSLSVVATPTMISAGSTVVTFGTIENVNITNLAATLTINGTNADNTLLVIEDGSGNVTYQLDGGAIVQVPSTTAIVFNAGDGDDELIVDYSATNGFFTNPITYHGGTQGPVVIG